MNNYGIFFTLGSKVIRLPVNPEELPDALQGANETYNILGIGEVTAMRTPLQRTIEIQGLFPARVDSYVVTPNQFMKPEEYITFFRNAMYNKNTLIYTPVRYMEDGTPFASEDIGFTCTVESFQVRETGAETGDFYYTLSIREYRDYMPQKVKTVPGKVAVTTSKTRSVAEDEIVVGTAVAANGNAYSQHTPVATAKPAETLSGKTASVARISNASPKAYLLKGNNGSMIGWVDKASIQPLKKYTTQGYLDMMMNRGVL